MSSRDEALLPSRGDRAGPRARRGIRLVFAEAAPAAVAFAALCAVVLSVAPQPAEPDDHAYRASIVAMSQGHLLSLSSTQAHALATDLGDVRFYVPAIGAISLLGAWLVTRIPGRAWLAGLTSAGHKCR
jgi:hypothetical protein